MEKRCACGQMMDIRLRSVIFSKQVTIANVPIYSCESCDRSEVLTDVKEELSTMIQRLGRQPEKQTIHFNEHNEVAFLLHEVTLKERANVPTGTIVRERVNQLLDMLLLAQSLDDRPWAEELHVRLSQITKGNFATYDLP